MLKAVDFLISNDNGENSTKNFKLKILTPPADENNVMPSLAQFKQWLISLQTAFSKFINEYDVLAACFWNKYRNSKNTLDNACVCVIFYLVISKILSTSEGTSFEKILRGEGLNNYTLRQSALLYIFESSEEMF